MINSLVTGKLATAPQQRTAKNGKPFATARLRVPTADPAVTLFASVVAFDSEAVDALLALGAGDAVSVAGSLKVGTWTDKEGNARPSLDLVADRLLSVYAIRKQRAAAGGGQPPQRGSSTEKPTHDAWKARQVNRPTSPRPSFGFDGADDLDF